MVSSLLKLYEYDMLADSVKRHSERVSECAVVMAKYAMPDLQAEYDGLSSEELIEAISTGCLCHDIGKLFYPSVVIGTRENINPVARSHVILGHFRAEECSRVSFVNKQYNRVISDIILSHHEQHDGKGYPNGLSAEDIPASASLCAIANKLDNLYGAYGTARDDGFEFVEGIMKAQSGLYFAPQAVEWFVAAKDELAELYISRYKYAKYQEYY